MGVTVMMSFSGIRVRPVLLLAFFFAYAMPANAQTFRDTLVGWADRLDQSAAELEGQPPQPIIQIGPGPTLKKGDGGERTGRLIKRLVELGLLPPDQYKPLYTSAVESAVRGFQESQRMRADGVVGLGTRQVFDRTPAEAARMMRHSAVSMRTLSAEAPETVLLVNLPNQETTLVRNGAIAMTIRSIVGRPSRETPLLEDHITHVIINPTWTVPPTILKEDKLPSLRARGTPGIQNAIVYLDGVEVMPEIVDWTNVTPGRVRIVQRPGNWNALGRFRFNLTNDEGIYLHSTNEPKLFERALRTISSGCVRLEDARGLAELLLADVGVTPQKIDAILNKGQPQWIKVNALPVRFVYWTATVQPDGAIRLHPDVYDLGEEHSGA